MAFRIHKIESGIIRSAVVLEIIASIVAGLSAAFWGMFASSEDWLYDRKMQCRAALRPLPMEKSFDPPVTVVGITEDNLADFARRSPVDRRYLADLIHAIQSARPSLIGIDYFLDMPSERTRKNTIHPDDAHLVRALSHYSNIICGRRMIETGEGFVPSDTRFWRKRIVPTGCRTGILNAHYDPDTGNPVWRRSAVFFSYRDPKSADIRLLPSFSFSLLLAKNRTPVPVNGFPLSEAAKLTTGAAPHEPFLIDYKYTEDRYSFRQINASTALRSVRMAKEGVYSLANDDLRDIITPADIARLRKAGILQGSAFPRRFRWRGDLTEAVRQLPPTLAGKALSLWDRYCLPVPALRGRIVLIGAKYYDSPPHPADLHRTPFTRASGKRRYGVNIHASILTMLLEDRGITEASDGLNFLIVLANLALVLLYASRCSFRGAVLRFLLHVALFLLLNAALFALAAFQYTAIPFLIGSLAVMTVVMLIRFIHTERSDERMQALLRGHAGEETVRQLLADRGQDYSYRDYEKCMVLVCRPLLPEQIPAADRILIREDLFRHIRPILNNRHAVHTVHPGGILTTVWTGLDGNRMESQTLPDLMEEIQACRLNVAYRWKKKHPGLADLALDSAADAGTVSISMVNTLLIEGPAVDSAMRLLEQHRGSGKILGSALRPEPEWGDNLDPEKT